MNEQPPRAARRRLIDELQALSESLGDGAPLPAALATPRAAASLSATARAASPLATSPHGAEPTPASGQPLLDLNAIFDDELFGDDDGEAPLLFWPLQESAGKSGAAPAPAADRSALIEQIVARRLPDLERQLRDQLRGLDVESLKLLLR